MEKIPYPSNYFDPYGDAPTSAQCTECGRWCDLSDMDATEMVPCLEYGEIPQGICLQCSDIPFCDCEWTGASCPVCQECADAD
jgi:hypothetical protein